MKQSLYAQLVVVSTIALVLGLVIDADHMLAAVFGGAISIINSYVLAITVYRSSREAVGNRGRTQRAAMGYLYLGGLLRLAILGMGLFVSIRVAELPALPVVTVTVLASLAASRAGPRL